MKPTPAIEKSVSALRPSGLFRRYAHWLHLQWPAGTVEPLPEVREDGSTSVPGLYITGDLTGVPLLKFALDSGARVVRAIAADAAFRAQQLRRPDGVLDLVIVGAGVSGMAAAVEARKAGLAFAVLDAARPYQTIADFPAGKPIFTYPPEMVPAGDLQVRAETKEALYEELLQQSRGIEVRAGVRVESVRQRDARFEVHIEGSEPVAALRVIVAIGRTGNYRRLGVPGEQLEKVHNRLHDPKDFAGCRVLVAGGGDSALESAAALDRAGAIVVLCHRGDAFPRARQQNVLALGNTRVMLRTEVREIRAESVVVQHRDAAPEPVANDFVFVLIGRDAPLDFFRRSGVRIRGEWTAWRIASLAAFLLFAFALYNWKSGGWLDELTRRAGAFPYSLAGAAQSLDPKSVGGILTKSAQGPAFWYTLAYSALILIFGIRRIRRRRSPYVTLQTAVLMAIQVLPLFLMPELLLPWLDARGWLPAAIADPLFPRANYGHGREFWRAYGFVLAWPLNVYNVFTPSPLWAWLAICFVQTFVIIPAMIYYWGKGAYCGWICSCGALAETLGDNQRHKMPHGPRWNRLNMAGQVVLAIAFLLLALRIAGWILPQAESLRRFNDLALSGSALSYKWVIDVFLAGVVGYGVYFWFSGRVWCRFFCPLAALMNIYTRFSRFRILADKKKCISCNVCTAVCHQGIDVMNFANKGEPMADPQCVRCGACVWSCPTDVLAFGQVDRTGNLISIDRLRARAGNC